MRTASEEKIEHFYPFSIDEQWLEFCYWHTLGSVQRGEQDWSYCIANYFLYS